MDLSRFPRHPLTFGPTPIERWPRLSDRLGGKVTVWAKREDVNSGLSFGGNKLRKLEYIVPDVLANGCDTLVSIGGVQSNHTRQVAAVAARLGLDCVLVQGSWVDLERAHPSDVAYYTLVGNLLLSRVLGAELVFSKEDFSIAIKESWQNTLEDVRRSGRKPYGIPAGASDHPLGGLGYVAFADEVRAQEKALGVRFDFIVVASASGSTQAGMVVGFAEDGRADRVLGIDVTAKPAETRAMVLRLAQATADLVGARAIDANDVVLDERFAAPAYGIPAPETIAAIRLLAKHEGVLTDPVYEGKSLQALIALVEREEIPAGSNVLYAHLGGVPAINAYASSFA
jgi:1-aminocyclopropane-1-carboxylate deaminase